MKALILAACLLLCGNLSLAQLTGGALIGGGLNDAVAGCSPVMTGHDFDETMDNVTDYDLTWLGPFPASQYVPDPNNTDATPLAGDCVSGELWFIDTSNTDSFRGMTYRDDISAETTVYSRFYFYAVTEDMSDNDEQQIYGQNASGEYHCTAGSFGAAVWWRQLAGDQVLTLVHDGSTIVDNFTFSMDTWYRIEVKSIDDVGIEWWISDESGTQLDNATSADDPGPIDRVSFGVCTGEASQQTDWYIDNLSIDFSARIGE